MHVTETFIPAKEVRSLVWEGETLVDWVDGGMRYGLDGRTEGRRVIYSYRFDAAVTSPGGEYVVIYEKVGTKGLLLRRGKIIREINRSFYHAEAYEYPVALFRLKDGREVMAHCPNECCQLDVEDLATGECLTSWKDRKPADFFHSRLVASPNGAYLASSGWFWHPWTMVKVYDLTLALGDLAHLDGPGLKIDDSWEEESTGVFFEDNRLVVALNTDDSPEIGKGVRIYDLAKSGPPAIVPHHVVIGTMMPVGTKHLVNFYKHPQLIELETGTIVREWPHIHSGGQTSSIIWDSKIPAIALDVPGKRCAIAGENGITVLQFKE